jgi:hypothetical protein
MTFVACVLSTAEGYTLAQVNPLSCSRFGIQTNTTKITGPFRDCVNGPTNALL